MKPKTFFILVVALFFSLLLVTQQGCKKEEKTNQPPTCTITAPANGWEIIQGETVTISVDATDNDGTIAEVHFFIDGVDKSSATNLPYNYEWNTSNESIGNHTIKATSLDNYGASKSNNISVTIIAGDTFTDPRDGQTYNIVIIGSQTWMAENLKYLPSVSPSSEHSYDDPYYYVYDYQGTDISEAKATANFQTYGVQYNWPAAVDACPAGWHLPSDREWKTLEMYLGMSQSEADGLGDRGTDEGKKLKSTSGWSDNGNGTDTVGFSALPGGYRHYGGDSDGLGYFGNWWTATAGGSTFAWSRKLSYYYDNVNRDGYGKGIGFSVRCVRDN
jgi:uncharacterized protein (TIGR02145 family)